MVTFTISAPAIRNTRTSRLQRAAIAALAALPASTFAATQHWDVNGATAGLGGAGTWNTTNSNWAPNNSGTAATSPWLEGNDAVFGGTAGAVTIPVGETRSVNSIQFTNSAGNYSIGNNSGQIDMAAHSFTNLTTVGNFLMTGGTTGQIISAVLNPAGDIVITNNAGGASATTLLRFTGNNSASSANIYLNGSGSPTAFGAANKLQLEAANAMTTGDVHFAKNWSQFLFGPGSGGTYANDFIINNTSQAGTFSAAIGANSGVTATLTGVISGSGDFYNVLGTPGGGAGTVVLANNMTYTGKTFIQSAATGVLKLGVSDALNPAADGVSFGAGTGANAGSLDLGGFNQTIASLGSGSSGTPTFGGITNSGGGQSVLTMKALSGTTNKFTGYAANIAGNTKVVVHADSVGGTLFNGNLTGGLGLTYSGGTEVNGGSLLISNTVGSGTGPGAVSVSGTSATQFGRFGGTGTAAGTVTVNNFGHVVPGDTITGGSQSKNTVPGDLKLSGGLILNAGANADFDLNTSNAIDTVTIGTTANLQDLTVPSTGNGTVTFNIADHNVGGIHNGTFTVLNYSNAINGDLSNILLTGPAGSPATFSLNHIPSNPGTSMGQLQVVISNAGNMITWTGATDNVWDVNGTTNWKDQLAAPIKFNDNDAVTFNDDGTGSSPITVTVAAGGVKPGLVTFSGTKDYIITGDPINDRTAGGTALNKNDGSTVTLSGANAFTGRISITGGTLIADNATALGSATATTAIAFSNSGTLRANTNLTTTRNLVTTVGGADTGGIVDTNGFNVTMGNLSSGTRPFVKNGAGTLELATAGSSYSGTTTINGGTVKVSANGAFGNASSVTQVQSGATLEINNANLNHAVTLFNLSTLKGSGSVPQATALTISGQATIDVGTGTNLTVTSASGTGTITKVSDGQLTVNPASGTSGLNIGALTVNAGTLKTQGDKASIIDSATITTGTGGGKLDLNNGGLIVENDTVTNIRSLLLAGSGGAGFASQTWDQPGIMSTDAAADPLTYGVGYMDNDQFILGAKSTFDNVSVPAGSILVKSTLSGDADLDWDVDDDDVTVLGIFYGGAGHWYEADFDYTGIVDDDDVTIIGITYGQTLPGAPAGVSAVPEPASLGLLGIATTGLLRRRRRN